MRDMQTSVLSRSQHGFSLIELLIATGLMTVALASLAQLFTLSVASNVGARVRTAQSSLASQKLEQLRALAFGFDGNGMPVVDLTTDTTGPSETSGGTGLSAGGSLEADVAGYVDYADTSGSRTDASLATFTRRWFIQPWAGDPDNTLVLQVLVTTRGRSAADAVRAVAVRTRKAR